MQQVIKIKKLLTLQVLTEENLDQLDELYKLISPTRDGESDYLESLSEASEHIVSLLDARDKPVVGTTSYKVYCLTYKLKDIMSFR